MSIFLAQITIIIFIALSIAGLWLAMARNRIISQRLLKRRDVEKYLYVSPSATPLILIKTEFKKIPDEILDDLREIRKISKIGTLISILIFLEVGSMYFIPGK